MDHITATLREEEIKNALRDRYFQDYDATPILRSAGKVTAVLPSEWFQTADATAPDDSDTLAHSHINAITHPHIPTFHLYAFLRGTRGRTSDTIYRTLTK